MTEEEFQGEMEEFMDKTSSKEGEILCERFRQQIQCTPQTLMKRIEELPDVTTYWQKQTYFLNTKLQKLKEEKEELWDRLESEIKNSDDPRKRSIANATKTGLNKLIESTKPMRDLTRKIKKQERLSKLSEDITTDAKFNLKASYELRIRLMELER